MKKAIFIDVQRGSLYKLALELAKHDVAPVMWLGYPGYLDKVSESFPSCEVYDYWRFNRGSTLIADNENVFPALSVEQINEFYVLKDKVIKMMDRQDDFGLFRNVEREALFYSLFAFFYSKVSSKDVDFVLSAHSPHLPATMVLYGACQIAGKHALHFRESAVVPLSYIASGFNGEVLSYQSDINKDLHLSYLYNYIDKFSGATYKDVEPHYMKLQQSSTIDKSTQYSCYPVSNKIVEGLSFYNPPLKKISYRVNGLDFLSDNPRVFFEASAPQNFKDLVYDFQLSEYYGSVNEVNLDSPFVYFPLHYEPEKTSNPDGGSFYNVYDALLFLRSYVPKEIKVVVKEHSTQLNEKYRGFVGRSPYFYKFVNSLYNVELISNEVDPLSLMKSALLTVSQTGTACLEAACLGKKSLILGSNWFSGFPNIYSHGSNLSFYDIVYRQEIFDNEEIKKSVEAWVKEKSVYGSITGSFVRLHHDLYAGLGMQDFKKTRKDVVSVLKENLII